MSEEGALLARFRRSGDEAAFRDLYGRRTPALYGLALRLTGGVESDAAEVVQEAWVRAVRSLPRFRGRSSFGTWLAGIAVNCHRELVRRRAPERDLPAALPAPPAGLDPADRITLERAVAALPTGYRTVLVLHDIEGYTHEEIAGMLSIRAGTCKSQLSRARRALRAVLDGPAEEERSS